MACLHAVAALCLAVATGILLRAFLIDDFSIAYVADHSNTKLDVIYKAVALWGSHEGSMLLWILLMALATCLVAFTQRKNEALERAHSVHDACRDRRVLRLRVDGF